MIDALVFDFDGLILDTEGPDFQAWQEIYTAYGCSLPLTVWSVAIGTVGAFDPYVELERQLGRPIDRATVYEQHQRRMLKLIDAETVRPGVETYLADARRLGIRRAVASSSPRDWVAGHLARLGLLEHFECLRCSDDVREVKPSPELYQSALEALGIRPEHAIALEDSPNGVLAAKRAGIFCVAVPNPLTRQLPLDHADLTLSSLQDLPLQALIERVGRSRR